MELREIEDDRALLVLPFAEEVVTIGDVVHGGAVSALVDTAAMAASWSAIEFDGEPPKGTTVGLTVDFLAAARAQDLLADALRPAPRQIALLLRGEGDRRRRRDPCRDRPRHLQAGLTQPVPSASGSLQTCLSQGGLIAKGAESSRNRLQRDEVDRGGRGVAAAAIVAGVAGVAAARDEQDAGLGAPAVLGAGADGSSKSLRGPIPASEAQFTTLSR